MDEHMKNFEICAFVQRFNVGKIPAKPSSLTESCDICERYMRLHSLVYKTLAPPPKKKQVQKLHVPK